MKIKTVLFDLDGTLADTSLDMCNSLNVVLSERNLQQVDCKNLKYHISRGAVGIIEYASEVNGRSIDSSLMRSDFLNHYSTNCFERTSLTKGMEQLLIDLDNLAIKWGVVTNKHSKYVNKIISGLGLDTRASCVVTGNMVDEPKPSPESLIKAMCLLDEKPGNIIYLGDDERDIIAGKSAGVFTAAADFGFIKDSSVIETWNADYIFKEPLDVMEIIQ